MTGFRELSDRALREWVLNNEAQIRADFGIEVVQEAVPLRNPGEYWAKYGGVWCRFKSRAHLSRAFDRLGPPVGVLS